MPETNERMFSHVVHGAFFSPLQCSRNGVAMMLSAGLSVENIDA